MTTPKTEPLKISITYPWISFVCAVLLCIIFLLINQPHILAPYPLPDALNSFALQMTLIAVVFIILFSDIQRFVQQKKCLKKHIRELEHELNHVWQGKKRLQERSHIYSGHADKLKRFISDKLLDYIEYDEKFLHFKSIAAEVRHNGVISYDIVRTALESAANGTQARKITPDTFTNTHRFGLPNNPNTDYQQALDAMKYLWDLLDLSTADNIALHIGNYLIECEEHYYQQELSNNNKSEGPPLTPYFSPSLAAIKTLGPLLESNETDRIIAQINTLKHDTSQESQYHETALFRIHLNQTDNLLGNENHLILLLENLVKNAQFFSTKNKYKQKSDRIALQLFQGKGYIQYKLYNRGPHIEKSNQIFDLGFSTRRVKEHHGKGLGLFFVKEIVDGYQGQITINNIANKEQTYTVIITLVSEEVHSRTISTVIEKHRIKTIESDPLISSESTLWIFNKPIANIEVSSSDMTRPTLFDELNTLDKALLLDANHPFAPEWQMEIKVSRKQWSLKFTPLDVGGVEFDIKLPSAEACLNGDEPTFKESFENEIENLNGLFNEFDDYDA